MGGYPSLAVGNHFFFVDGHSPASVELYALTNELPLSTADNGGSVTAGRSVTINVLSNDADPDGDIDAATVVIGQAPAGGSATVNKSGVVTYKSRADFSGKDSFTYTVADDQGARTRATKVSVTVVPP
jgi:hypothetical protein